MRGTPVQRHHARQTQCITLGEDSERNGGWRTHPSMNVRCTSEDCRTRESRLPRQQCAIFCRELMQQTFAPSDVNGVARRRGRKAPMAKRHDSATDFKHILRLASLIAGRTACVLVSEPYQSDLLPTES